MELAPRIVHIEGRVDRLETDVGEIKDGVKKLLSRPTSPGFGQVIGTMATTLVVVGSIFAFFEWRITKATARTEIDVVDLRTEMRSDRVDLVDMKIKTAVLEERANWLRSRENWTAQTVPAN